MRVRFVRLKTLVLRDVSKRPDMFLELSEGGVMLDGADNTTPKTDAIYAGGRLPTRPEAIHNERRYKDTDSDFVRIPSWHVSRRVVIPGPGPR
jgi:hypothetical protein